MQFTTLQYKKLTMYPYYYPFTYTYQPFTSYFCDNTDANQYFTFAQQFMVEQSRKNKEEVNTTYSAMGNSAEENHSIKNVTDQAVGPDFVVAKEDVVRLQKRIPKQFQAQFKVKLSSTIKKSSQRLRYVNKNFQSNIINKIFSFLWSEDKSRIYVNRILKDKTKTMLYYDYIRIVRKYCKRYINKEYLMDLCDYQPHHIAFRIVARHADKFSYFTMQDLSVTIRKLIYVYLKDVCCSSILTSKKMRVDIWRDHFQKARNILEYLFEGLSSQQYDLRMSQSYDQIYSVGRSNNASE